MEEDEDYYSFCQSLCNNDSAEESSINDYDPTKKKKPFLPSYRRGCYKKKEVKKPCSVSGCFDPFYSKRLCRKHYRRSIQLQMGPCSIEGCTNKTRQRNLCYKHYDEWKKDGMEESSSYSSPDE